MKRIAIFASGTGSNTQKIIDHFRNSNSVEIVLIACNNPGAGVVDIAAKEAIPLLQLVREEFFHGNHYLPVLEQYRIDLIVLAGFLWKIPDAIIDAYPLKIINIHPALLPKYGGKGMYGEKVHASVIKNKETESGITIHYVDGHYDNGDIILQVTCPVNKDDDVQSLSARIHQLEHEYYPQAIESILNKGRSH